MRLRATAVMICAVLAVTSHPVAAQGTARLAAPWPSSDLATGTVVVEVIEGTFSVPHASAAVTLVVNGVRRTAKTDERGRVQFDNLAVGATVQASVSATRLVSSERFSEASPDETEPAASGEPALRGSVLDVLRTLLGDHQERDTVPTHLRRTHV